MKQPLSFIQKIAEQAAAAAGATVTAGQILACTTRLAVPVAPVQLQTKSPTPQLSEGGAVPYVLFSFATYFFYVHKETSEQL